MVWIYLNGEFVVADQGMLVGLTPGVLCGYGVFETMLYEWGSLKFFDHHYDRFLRGVKAYTIPWGHESQTVLNWVRHLIRKNDFKCARVRLAAWRSKGKIHIAVVCQKYKTFSRQKRERGYSACISRLVFKAHTKSNLKTLKYDIFRRSLIEAKDQDFDESLLMDFQGNIIEGATSNIFWVKNGVILTPPVISGCLNGITRKCVLDIARSHGIPVEYSSLSLKTLKNVEEAFLTNSLIGIMPLRSVNGDILKIDSKSSLTKGLMNLYQD